MDWKTQETKLKNKLEFEDCMKLKLNFAVWAQMRMQATQTVCQISQAVTDLWINHTFATYSSSLWNDGMICECFIYLFIYFVFHCDS